MSERRAPPPPINLPSPSQRRRLVIIIVVALLAPIASLVVLGGVFLQTKGWTTYNMPSSSMLPSVRVGDYFLVDQQAYGHGRLPRRGDVIVFYAPSHIFLGPQAPAGRGAPFIKRILGIPGDRIIIKGGVPELNGTPLVQKPLGEYAGGSQAYKGRRLREYLFDGASYEILKLSLNGMLGNGPLFVVPTGAYFVLGDNRDDSLDSRSRAGESVGWYVPLADIVGQAKYVYWSGFDRLGRIGSALK